MEPNQLTLQHEQLLLPLGKQLPLQLCFINTCLDHQGLKVVLDDLVVLDGEVAGLHLPPLLGLDYLLVLVVGAHRRGQGQRLQLQHLLVHHQIAAKEDKTVWVIFLEINMKIKVMIIRMEYSTFSGS